MKHFNLGGVVTAGLLATLMIGCRGSERNGGSEVEMPTVRESRGESPRGGPADAEIDARSVILFMGTSLTAGLGLPIEQSFPYVIGTILEERGLSYRVVNAGVSGETSAGARRRIDWLLEQPFDVLVLETGANDMLRGTPPEELEANIQAIIDGVRRRRPKTQIVLAGMRAAPNLGGAYVARFEAVYHRLAERNDVELIPFILEGVAADTAMNLGDGMHPNAAGQRQVAENVWRVLAPVLGETDD